MIRRTALEGRYRRQRASQISDDSARFSTDRQDRRRSSWRPGCIGRIKGLELPLTLLLRERKPTLDKHPIGMIVPDNAQRLPARPAIPQRRQEAEPRQLRSIVWIEAEL